MTAARHAVRVGSRVFGTRQRVYADTASAAIDEAATLWPGRSVTYLGLLDDGTAADKPPESATAAEPAGDDAGIDDDTPEDVAGAESESAPAPVDDAPAVAAADATPPTEQTTREADARGNYGSGDTWDYWMGTPYTHDGSWVFEHLSGYQDHDAPAADEADQ